MPQSEKQVLEICAKWWKNEAPRNLIRLEDGTGRAEENGARLAQWIVDNIKGAHFSSEALTGAVKVLGDAKNSPNGLHYATPQIVTVVEQVERPRTQAEIEREDLDAKVRAGISVNPRTEFDRVKAVSRVDNAIRRENERKATDVPKAQVAKVLPANLTRAELIKSGSKMRDLIHRYGHDAINDRLNGKS